MIHQDLLIGGDDLWDSPSTLHRSPNTSTRISRDHCLKTKGLKAVDSMSTKWRTKCIKTASVNPYLLSPFGTSSINDRKLFFSSCWSLYFVTGQRFLRLGDSCWQRLSPNRNKTLTTKWFYHNRDGKTVGPFTVVPGVTTLRLTPSPKSCP